MEYTWEYDRRTINFKSAQALLEGLNALGASGWEIIWYKETKPKRFGDEFESIVLIKKMKSCTKEKQ